MSYFGGGNSGFNQFGFTGIGGNLNLGNNAHGFTSLEYDGLHSGFNLGNNANGFAFVNNFGFGGANTQITPRAPCPPGCYYPIPGQPPCTQGGCPNGCCQMG